MAAISFVTFVEHPQYSEEVLTANMDHSIDTFSLSAELAQHDGCTMPAARRATPLCTLPGSVNNRLIVRYPPQSSTVIGCIHRAQINSRWSLSSLSIPGSIDTPEHCLRYVSRVAAYVMQRHGRRSRKLLLESDRDLLGSMIDTYKGPGMRFFYCNGAASPVGED